METLKNLILIVEDDAGLLELLSEKVQESGCDVFCAESTEIAFNWLKDNQPTLILLDYSLPDMNGSEFIDELANRNISVPPFILATGQGDERIAVKMMKLGARDYIVKDTNYLEFIPIVLNKVCKEIQNENKLQFAEQEVSRISKHYQAIIEKSPDGCVLIDGNGNFKYASPSALRMFGYNEEDLFLTHPNEITHPDELQMVLSALGRLMHDPTYVPVLEYRFKHCNGTWIWIESTFSNILADDTVNAIVINFRNISERKLAEETLKLRETYLTAIIENLPGIIWLKDAQSHIQFTNTKFAHTFGGEKPEDLIGKTDLDFSPKEHAERYLADDKKVVTSKKPLHVEELIYDQNSIKWFETFKLPIFDENNVVIGTAGYAQDISERKNAEEALRFSMEKFRNMFDSSIVGKSITTIEGNLSVNKAYSDIVGYTQEELSKMKWADFTHVDDIEFNNQIIESILNGKKESSQWEKRFIHKQGHIVWVDIFIVLLRDGNGNPVHFFTEINDITQRKEAEALLNHERELYLDLVNTQPAGIYRIRVAPKEKWDEDAWSSSESSPYKMELASDRFCQILGLTRKEFENNSKIIYDLIHPDDRIEFKRRNEEANIKKIPFYWDCRLLINGKIKWVHFESVPRQLLTGEMIYTGILYDISDRVLAQHALEENRDVLNKLLFASTEFIDSKFDNINYRRITDNLLEISGAKYASFNLFDENGLDFTTVAISGIDGLQDKIKTFLGYELQNKKWKSDPVRSEKLKDKISTRFDSFFELTGFALSKKISLMIEKMFNLGEVWVVQITKNNITLGDFSLVFTKDNILKNKEIVELYAAQIGLYIERVNSEKALHKSEDIYRNLVLRIPDGVYKSTTDGKFLEVNPAMIKMLGYESKEELLNIDIKSDLYFDIADREARMEKNKNDIMSIFQLRKKDGSGIWIEDHGWFNRDVQGNIVSHEGVLRDITERKMAADAIRAREKLLREAQEVARLGSYAWDITTGYWTSSEIMDDIFGINNAYVKSTEGWLALIHPEWQEIMSDYISNEVIGNHQNFDKEYKIIRQSDGKECWVHGLGKLEFNQLNEPIKLVGTISNIDDRKQAEIALAEKMNDLIRFQNVTVGRELMMIELKKEINQLLIKSGQQAKYKIVE